MQGEQILSIVLGNLGFGLIALSFLFKKIELIRLINASASIILVFWAIFTMTGYNRWVTLAWNGTYCIIHSFHLLWLVLRKKHSVGSKPGVEV